MSEEPEVFGTEMANTPQSAEPGGSGEMNARSRVVPSTLAVDWNALAPRQNYCAHAALVTVMAAFGATGGRSYETIFSQALSQYPPDMLWGNWGTHPDQLVRAALAQGMNCRHASVSNWYPGGFDNPAMNNQFWEPHRDYVFGLIQRGGPAICLVDGGMLADGASNPFTLHYVVAHDYRNGTIALCNDIVGGRYSDNRMDFAQFARAWECRLLPTGAPKFFAAFVYP